MAGDLEHIGRQHFPAKACDDESPLTKTLGCRDDVSVELHAASALTQTVCAGLPTGSQP